MNRFKSLTFLIGIFMAAAFASTSFAGSGVPNYGAFGGEKVDWYSNDVGAVYKKDWTKDQIKEFVSKPWSKEEKEKLLGDEGMGYILDKQGFTMAVGTYNFSTHRLRHIRSPFTLDLT